MAETSDDDLVRAAQSGDRTALDALLRRHHQRLYAVCRRLAGNDADAADALQEALILIVRRLDTFDGRAKFTTWAHRVATNACLDELRRRGRRPTPGLVGRDSDDDRTSALDEAHALATHTDPPVEDGVVSAMTVDAALAALPEEFRVPLVLRDVGGHDYAEIAEILDLPPGTVRSRISRGRTRLAAVLTGGPPRPDAGNQDDPARRRTITP